MRNYRVAAVLLLCISAFDCPKVQERPPAEVGSGRYCFICKTGHYRADGQRFTPTFCFQTDAARSLDLPNHAPHYPEKVDY
jgi:hypothetical protein